MADADNPPPVPSPGFWVRLMSGFQPKDAITITISVIALVLTGLNFWWNNLRVHDEAYGYVARVGPAKTRLAAGESSPMAIDLFVRNAGNRPISLSEAYITLAYQHCEDDHVMDDGSKPQSSPLPAQRIDTDAIPFTEKPGEAGVVKFVLPEDFFGGWFQPTDTQLLDIVASLTITTVASNDTKHGAVFDCLFKVDPKTNSMQMLNDYTFKNFQRVSLLGDAPK